MPSLVATAIRNWRSSWNTLANQNASWTRRQLSYGKRRKSLNKKHRRHQSVMVELAKELIRHQQAIKWVKPEAIMQSVINHRFVDTRYINIECSISLFGGIC